MSRPRDPISPTLAESRRTLRIYLLLAAVCCMALGDLYATLTYSQSIGMVELNPIAAMLLESDSHVPLICYKIGCTLLSCVLILLVRHNRCAEVGSWTLALIMTLLTFHWYSYNQVITQEMTNIDFNQTAHIMHLLANAR